MPFPEIGDAETKVRHMSYLVRDYSSSASHSQPHVRLTPVRSAFADDPDFAELIEFFVDALPERRQALADDFKAGRIDALRVTAHQLKGAGGGYGFDGLSSLASHLEEMCKSGEPGEISAAVLELCQHIDRICL